MMWCLSATLKILCFYQHPSQSGRYLKTLLHIFKKYTSIKTFPACNLLSRPLHAMNLNVAVAKNEKENRRSVSRYSGSELRMRDNNQQLWFTVWWEEHRSLRLTREQKKTGTNTEADSKSVNQTGPTDSFPSSSGAPGLALSSNTERRRSKSGERKREKEEEEEEKTGHRCEACRTQAHGQDEKTIHTHTHIQRNRLEH